MVNAYLKLPYAKTQPLTTTTTTTTTGEFLTPVSSQQHVSQVQKDVLVVFKYILLFTPTANLFVAETQAP
jgi:hypothetical protein